MSAPEDTTPQEWADETAEEAAPTPSPEELAHAEERKAAAAERSRERVRRRQRVKDTGVNPLMPEGMIPILELLEAIDAKLDVALGK